jgi:TonB family protein
MPRRWSSVVLVLAASAALVLPARAAAQASAAPVVGQPVIVPLEWPRPVYPQIAQSARVSGDVEVAIDVHRDGTVAAAHVVSGPPLLHQAVEDAARRARFECRGCREAINPYTLYATFRLSKDEAPVPVAPIVVSPTQGWVTVISDQGAPFTIADEWVVESKRSARCLWIWRCGVASAGLRCILAQ